MFVADLQISHRCTNKAVTLHTDIYFIYSLVLPHDTHVHNRTTAY